MELEGQAKGQILGQFRNNPLLWGKFYLPNHFRIKSPPFHLEIIRTAMDSKFLAVASPRGSSKSTLLSFLYPLHSLCFGKDRFIVIVSNTYRKASMALENIKKELRENVALAKDYPIEIRRDAEGDSIFRHMFGYEIRILCKGNEQIGSVRGEKFGAYRPTLIIVDDVEDDEMVRNPERRIILKDLYDEALIPAGDFNNLKVLVIGTILHDDSQMAKLVSDKYYPEYKKLFYQARIENPITRARSSLWNEKWSLEDLAKIEIESPDVFAKEYQNDPVSGSSQVFFKEDFRYWRIDNGQYILFGKQGEIVNRGALSDCKGAIAGDLAWEEGKENDFAVIMPGLLTPQSDLLIEDYIAKKGLRPDELEEILYSMRDKLHGWTGKWIPIGFEKAKIEKVVKWILIKAGQRRNDPLSFTELQWETDKISRIKTKLQPRYAQHMIYHKVGMGELEHQLTRFPSATHDDLPDAEQGLIQLLKYPGSVKQIKTPEDRFMALRKFAMDSKSNGKGRYHFGRKGKDNFVPAQVSPI